MLNEFKGKTALVVGGTSGIGEAAVNAFVARGCNVVFAGLETDLGERIEQRINNGGQARSCFVRIDVREEEQVARLVARAAAEFGQIHYAFNNAGFEGPYGPVHEIDEADFDRVIGINLKGVWLCLKHELRHMRKFGSGAIVNTSSSAGVVSIPQVGAYSASKHGIVGLSKAAALENADTAIRINVIAPGPVRTGLLSRMVAGHHEVDAIAAMVPVGRIAEPAEIADAVLWLCSSANSFMTGHTLILDGGLTIA